MVNVVANKMGRGVGDEAVHKDSFRFAGVVNGPDGVDCNAPAPVFRQEDAGARNDSAILYIASPWRRQDAIQLFRWPPTRRRGR